MDTCLLPPCVLLWHLKEGEPKTRQRIMTPSRCRTSRVAGRKDSRQTSEQSCCLFGHCFTSGLKATYPSGSAVVLTVERRKESPRACPVWLPHQQVDSVPLQACEAEENMSKSSRFRYLPFILVGSLPTFQLFLFEQKWLISVSDKSLQFSTKISI